MGNKVIQNVVVSQMEKTDSYTESSENLNGINHLQATNLNGVELSGDEENQPASARIAENEQSQQVLDMSEDAADGSLRQRKLSANQLSSSVNTLDQISTTPKKSILATATNFAISPLKEKFFKLTTIVKPSTVNASNAVVASYSSSSETSSESSDLISTSTASGSSSMKAARSSSNSLGANTNSVSMDTTELSLSGSLPTNTASLASIFESTFESSSSAASSSSESELSFQEIENENSAGVAGPKANRADLESRRRRLLNVEAVVAPDNSKDASHIFAPSHVRQARETRSAPKGRKKLLDPRLVNSDELAREVEQAELQALASKSSSTSKATTSSASPLEPTVIAPLLQSISVSPSGSNPQQHLSVLVQAPVPQVKISSVSTERSNSSSVASSMSSISYNNNNSKFSSDCKMPPRLECLLDMPPVDYETAALHSWNPDDRSLNIFVKESDPFTLHRHPVAQSTDCIRTKFGYTKGMLCLSSFNKCLFMVSK
jgi:hypothetical protein